MSGEVFKIVRYKRYSKHNNKSLNQTKTRQLNNNFRPESVIK